MAKLEAGPNVYSGMRVGDRVFRGDQELTGVNVLALFWKTAVKQPGGSVLLTSMDSITGEKSSMVLGSEELVALVEWVKLPRQVFLTDAPTAAPTSAEAVSPVRTVEVTDG